MYWKQAVAGLGVALLLLGCWYVFFIRKCLSATCYPIGQKTLNESFGHAYVINLDRRSDRMASFDQQAKKIGLQYERVSAVDYHDIVIPAWVHTKKYEQMRFTDGAYALCKSTEKVIQDAIEKGYESILIMEDDAIFVPNAQQLWKKMQTKLPEKWQVLYFSQIHYDVYDFVECVPLFGKKPEASIIKLKRTFSCAAYALHKSVFKDYLDFLKNPNMPIDNWLYEMYQSKSKTAYGTYPALCTQADGFSDIEADNSFVKRKVKKDGSQA